MAKKVAIITGADGGMGRIITKRLAMDGYKVIMACENKQKAKPVCDAIKAETNTNIELYQLDLASIQSIKQFVQEVTEAHSQIDLLLNNAGALPAKPTVTQDGYELVAGVNYLGHYILSTELLPFFSKSTRIVNMASFSHKWFRLSPQFLKPVNQRNYNRFRCYSNSKLALVYFTLDKSEEWKKRGIMINCADPGIVNTSIISMHNKVIDSLCNIFFRPFIKTPAQGAETMLWLATSPETENLTGGYFRDKKPNGIPSRITNSKQRIWLRNLTNSIIAKHNL
ncbi:SDR family NAD(P)-dependent oxidoreductase [Bacteroidales bacterium OttesenSCG-928-B11]|nr:SDR family NAD(P)-dependent oxidoreductase [Bacteroidales bacterium OttesenSCG-928-C03]MDL2311962.1 SDR family NAD(P)-dependent oxidoreductase [Bacteroidales bacterium OttesenSCG-928-B11]